ncbi:MAG: DUF5615 family PIN-like protein [Candidatus Dormibacteria bacterium]
MRLLLDAHLSGRVIGRRLRETGHDVLAVDEDSGLRGADDADLLQLAAAEGRILITCDVADFPDLLRDQAEAGEKHAGCIIFVGLDHSEFGSLLSAPNVVLARFPSQADWVDRPLFVGRPG